MQFAFGVKFLIDFGLILRSIWGPKSIQNEVGNRIGKVIGKRRAKDGLIGANLGSKMGSCWVENRRRLESKSNIEKQKEKKRVIEVDPRPRVWGRRHGAEGVALWYNTRFREKHS